MKKLFTYSATIALCSQFAFAAQQTITGQLTDSMCKSDHAMMQKGAMKMSDKECTQMCAKAGQKYALVSNGKVYKIANQDFAALSANAGGPVTVTGDVAQDGTITVAKVQPVKK